jgi:hypothetical protein
MTVGRVSSRAGATGKFDFQKRLAGTLAPPCRPDGAGDWFGSGFYKDSALDGAADAGEWERYGVGAWQSGIVVSMPQAG